jgi:predicted aldo/keto reductase-like oxidoreductase
MSKHDKFSISRRSFIHGLGGGALLAGSGVLAHSAESTASEAMPRRVLGRTKLEVSTLSLGTWPCGKCDTIDAQGVAALVGEALDLGINYIDAARAYDNAEQGIGMALKGRRDQVILSTKVWADTADEARTSFEESLRQLQTDYVDLAYLHSMGDRDGEKVMKPDGALTYLLQQKKAGKARFVGISGHCRPKTFVPVIETGELDVVLMAMNFVDRHTYGFEEKVLPAARQQKMGVACMKVFGGMKGGFDVADGADTGPQMGRSRNLLQCAVRYSLGLPGVATLVIGCHTSEQLRQNVEWVKKYQPLSDTDHQRLVEHGRQLAQEWGPHLGRVV